MKSRAETNDTGNKDTGGPRRSKVGFWNNHISILKPPITDAMKQRGVHRHLYHYQQSQINVSFIPQSSITHTTETLSIHPINPIIYLIDPATLIPRPSSLTSKTITHSFSNPHLTGSPPFTLQTTHYSPKDPHHSHHWTPSFTSQTAPSHNLSNPHDASQNAHDSLHRSSKHQPHRARITSLTPDHSHHSPHSLLHLPLITHSIDFHCLSHRPSHLPHQWPPRGSSLTLQTPHRSPHQCPLLTL